MTTTTPKHTPTPWMVGNDGDPVILAGDNSWNRGRVAILPRVFVEEREANAAHIVRCVNGFDGMLDALRQVYAWLDNIYDVDEESGTGRKTEHPSGGGEILRAVRNAPDSVGD